MVILNNQFDICHPDGKIILLNGNILDCYPKEGQPRTGNETSDTAEPTLTALSLKKNGPKADAEDGGYGLGDGWRSLFLREAFFLHDHRDAVYADSRMFLAPVPLGNNLSYTGSAGLGNATLGVYLEWWDACEKSVIKDGNGIRALTYLLAGSPLSGRNSCSVVTRDGKTETVEFSGPFSDLWGPFTAINRRYSEAKQRYRAYTLQETIELLRR